MRNCGFFEQKTLLVGQMFARQPDMLWLWKTHKNHIFMPGTSLEQLCGRRVVEYQNFRFPVAPERFILGL